MGTGVVSRARARAKAANERATAELESQRQRIPAVDVAVRVHQRDKQAAGTLLGSALSLRLFLFFVPVLLFATGAAGVLGRFTDIDSIASDVGITSSLATEIDSAFAQGAITPWVAILVGLSGIAWTGRSLTRALVLSCALSWDLGGKQKVPARAVGVVVGIIVGIALAGGIINRIRDAAGIAVAGVSLIAVAVIYIVLWVLLYQALPRGTADPGAALPGASFVALGLAGMQAFTQFFLPQQIEHASSIYGTIGVAIAVLGWFFFLGRALAFSFALNAVIYEQVGSVSVFVFGLPGLRVIPRKVPAVGRFFDLEGFGSVVAEPSQGDAEHPF